MEGLKSRIEVQYGFLVRQLLSTFPSYEYITWDQLWEQEVTQLFQDVLQFKLNEGETQSKDGKVYVRFLHAYLVDSGYNLSLDEVVAGVDHIRRKSGEDDRNNTTVKNTLFDTRDSSISLHEFMKLVSLRADRLLIDSIMVSCLKGPKICHFTSHLLFKSHPISYNFIG